MNEIVAILTYIYFIETPENLSDDSLFPIYS